MISSGFIKAARLRQTRKLPDQSSAQPSYFRPRLAISLTHLPQRPQKGYTVKQEVPASEILKAPPWKLVVFHLPKALLSLQEQTPFECPSLKADQIAPLGTADPVNTVSPSHADRLPGEHDRHMMESRPPGFVKILTGGRCVQKALCFEMLLLKWQWPMHGALLCLFYQAQMLQKGPKSHQPNFRQQD